jgi:hypothetical protein
MQTPTVICYATTQKNKDFIYTVMEAKNMAALKEIYPCLLYILFVCLSIHFSPKSN